LSDAAGRRTRPPVHAPRQSVGDPRDAPPVARGRRTGLALLAAAGRGRLLRQQPAPGSHLPHRRLGPRLDDGRLQRWRHLEHETGRRPPGPGPENAVAVGVPGCSSAANSVTSPRRPGARVSPRACRGPYPPRQETPMTTPADELRTAADKLRKLLDAPELTPGPWLSLDHGDRMLYDGPGAEDEPPVYVIDEPMSNGANADY